MSHACIHHHWVQAWLLLRLPGPSSIIMHVPPHPVTLWVVGSSQSTVAGAYTKLVYRKNCCGVCVVGELDSEYSRCQAGPWRALSPLSGRPGLSGARRARLGPALPSDRPGLAGPIAPAGPGGPGTPGGAWRARRPGGPCGAGGARWTGTPDLGQQTPERGADVGLLVEIVALQGDITAPIEADGIGLRVCGTAIPGALEE